MTGTGPVLRMAQVLFILALVLLSGSCATVPSTPFKTFDIFKVDPATYQGIALSSGQIVVGATANPTELLYILGSSHFSPYVHAGILIMEEDGPMVYESFGSGMPIFPNERPTDAISGSISKTPFDTYIRRQGFVEIFDPEPVVSRQRIVEFVKYHYRNRTPFDPYFDSTDHTKLFCTEFVALAMESAGGSKIKTVPGTKNRSLQIVYDWLGLQHKKTIPAILLVEKRTKVASLSSSWTHADFRAMKAIRKEIFRRFTPEQKLGNIMQWSHGTLKYREDIEIFIKQVAGLPEKTYASASDKVVDMSVHDLADRIFGAVKGEIYRKRLSSLNLRDCPGEGQVREAEQEGDVLK